MNKPLALLERAGVPIVDRLDLPARAAEYAAMPEVLRDEPVGRYLATALGDGQLFNHQGLVMGIATRGENVVLATATGSGKTLPAIAAGVQHLGEGGVVLVLATTKALASDLARRYRSFLSMTGLDKPKVSELTGNTPMSERLDAINGAHFVVATPDVIQSWLMSQISTPLIRRFFQQLSLVILDEAHCYENVLGSNMAYLLRRLRAACLRARAPNRRKALQFFAATGTMEDPGTHLEKLTGLPFAVVDETHNGAPRAPMTLLHLEGPERGAPLEAMVVELVQQLIAQMDTDTIIVFADGRQCVERIAKLIDRPDVLAYRSGFEDEDRQIIEAQLWAGKCRVIISTSALELGIDLPFFVIGLLLGLPPTKKSLRQRVGRVGRAKPGVCAIIAPATTFSQFGSSLADYWYSAVEPSHLYLDNAFIQYAAARCLIDECEAVGGEPVLPRDIDWPDGFETIFGYAVPGAQRPRLFDAIAALGGDSPHHGYPLRQIGETRFAVRRAYGGDGEPIGTISHQQALREAAPGMTYLHAGRVYRVRDWRNLSHDRSVRVEPIKSGARTHPLLYKSVNLSISADGVIEGRLLSNGTSFLAETQLQVMEAVDGYRIGKTTLLYRDLRQANPAMTRKQYEFATTGIVLQIDEPWFKGTSQAALNTRRSIGRALRQLVMRERSISGSEIDFADSNIAIFDAQGPRRRTDCLVIYDCVYGGLRLTESLFSHFLDYLRRLARAGAAVGEEALLSSTLVDRLIAWFSTLSAANPHDLPELAVDREGDDYVIYAPNSEVAIMHQGVLCPRILLEPQIMSIGESDMLMYRYETAPGASAYVAHDRIHPVGHNWRRALWDARSNQVREFDL